MAGKVRVGKRLVVLAGRRGEERPVEVVLPGVLPTDRLTPELAGYAARIAFGHRNGVTVQDVEAGIGYRLYQRSERKLHLDE